MGAWEGRVAWGLCGLTCGLGVLLTWMFFAYPEYRTIGWPVLTLGSILWAATGALIVSRHPGHRVGWLFVGTGLVIAVDDPLIMYADNILDGGDLGPYAAGQVAAWLVDIVDLPLPILLIGMLFLLFPDGTPPTPRWRPVLWAAGAWFVLFVAAMVVAVDPRDLGGLDVTVPTPPAGAEAILETRALGSVLILGIGAAAVVVRMRRARGEQRQQLRWLATACAAAAVALVPPVMADDVDLFGRIPGWLLLLPLHLAFAGVAAAAGLAILRYRLYDIDLIISRTIVLTALTAFVIAGYVAVVVAIGAAVGGRASAAFWPSLLATAVVALAFQPVRTRVLRLADRVVYGARAAPYEALAEFSSRLGEIPSAAELLPRVAEATAHSVGARWSRVQLDLPDRRGLTARWPADAAGDEDLELPVKERSEILGRIAVAMPLHRPLRKADRRLLEDFTDQIGLAFRNARLEAELRLRVDQVTRRTEELAVSRRRLVVARDDERRRLAAAIGGQVLDHLEPLVEEMRHSSFTTAAERERTATLLDQHVAAANAALDALRQLSRGIVPAVLRRRGLAAALVAAGHRVDVQVAPSAVRRFDPQVETAAYLCAQTALGPRTVTVRPQNVLVAGDDRLVMTVTGIGEDVTEGPDWQNVLDRVEALRGEVVVNSRSTEPATLRLEVPLATGEGQRLAAAQAAASVSGPKADLVR
jgi:hypothetical protein